VDQFIIVDLRVLNSEIFMLKIRLTFPFFVIIDVYFFVADSLASYRDIAFIGYYNLH